MAKLSQTNIINGGVDGVKQTAVVSIYFKMLKSSTLKHCVWYFILGNFAFINVLESGMTSGDMATLSINGLRENVNYCLTFYRHMYGSHIGSLRVNMMCCYNAVDRQRCKSIFVFISNQAIL